MSNIFQSAQDNWPEDEAYGLIQSYNRRKLNEWDGIELGEQLAKDIAHMHKCFLKEKDGAELIKRFDAYIELHLVK